MNWLRIKRNLCWKESSRAVKKFLAHFSVFGYPFTIWKRAPYSINVLEQYRAISTILFQRGLHLRVLNLYRNPLNPTENDDLTLHLISLAVNHHAATITDFCTKSSRSDVCMTTWTRDRTGWVPKDDCFMSGIAARYSMRRLARSTKRNMFISGFKPRPQHVSRTCRQIHYPLSYYVNRKETKTKVPQRFSSKKMYTYRLMELEGLIHSELLPTNQIVDHVGTFI